MRNAIPTWGSWNPSKIFPEILQPIISQLGVIFFYPINHDYVNSLAIAYGITISIFIIIYFWLTYKLINKLIPESNTFTKFFAEILFVILHYLVYRVSESNNEYVFYSENVCCVFNYVIPSLFNIIVVLIINLKKDRMNFGVLLLMIYLAIFSNLFSNYIIAIYAFIEIISGLIKERKLNLKDEFILWLIDILWCICAIFELSGGRAESLEVEETLFQQIIATIQLLPTFFLKINKSFKILFFVIIISFILMHLVKKDVKDDINKVVLYKLFGMLVLEFVFILLLCAKTEPTNIIRVHSWSGIIITVFIILYIMGMDLIKHFPISSCVLPLMVLILFFNIDTSYRTFSDSNLAGSSGLAYQIDTYIVNKIVDADKKNLNSIAVEVPKYDTSDNWPLSDYGFNWISDSLYKNGIIKKSITIEIKYIDVNEYYSLIAE